MKIKVKLLLNAAVISVLMIVLGATNLYSNYKLSANDKELKAVMELETFIDLKEIDHLKYMNKVSNMIFDVKPDESVVVPPTDCSFGKWYYETKLHETDQTKKFLLDEIEKPHEEIHNYTKKIYDTIRTKGKEGVGQATMQFEQVHEAAETLLPLFTKYKETVIAEKNKLRAENDRLLKSTNVLNVTLTLILIAAGAVMSLLIANSITKPLQKVIAMLEDITRGEGDLTKRLDQKSNDELGRLSGLFNVFINNIETMVKNIKDSASSVTKAADEISVGNQD